MDLRRRVASTRLPDKETAPGQSQGVPLETIQTIVRYWATEYDWRKFEACLNAIPQFVTEIHSRSVESRGSDPDDFVKEDFEEARTRFGLLTFLRSVLRIGGG